MRPVRELIKEIGSEIGPAFRVIALIPLALIGLWLLAGILIPWIYSGTESSRDKSNRADALAASGKNAAVLIRPGNNEFQILLIDFATGTQTRLGSRRFHLSSPSLSPDGQRLLFVRTLVGKFRESELVSCDTVDFVCRMVLKISGTMHSQIELPGGRILYVSSPYHSGHNGYTRTNRNDFWLFDPATGARQVTDFRLYELYSISVASDIVYFNAFGSPNDAPLIPRDDSKSTAQSHMFQLPFDADERRIQALSIPLKPLFVKEGSYAIRPKVSADGSLFSFLRTALTGGAYRFDLVVLDTTTGKERTVSTTSDGYSIPVIVGDAIYARDLVEDFICIRKVTQGGQRSEIVVNIFEPTVGNLNTVELTITP